MLVLFLCKRTYIDHFQEYIIRYVYTFKDPDPVLILELAIRSLPTLSSNWTWGLRALADYAVLPVLSSLGDLSMRTHQITALSDSKASKREHESPESMPSVHRRYRQAMGATPGVSHG
jgi:hypothetical protein